MYTNWRGSWTPCLGLPEEFPVKDSLQSTILDAGEVLYRLRCKHLHNLAKKMGTEDDPRAS